MIRVNLLEGTAEQRVSLQKTKVAARRGQILLMLGACLAVFVIVIGIDSLWTSSANARAKTDLEQEQAVAKKLEADVARKTALENELKQVDERIRVIKQLRAEQKGPVAMLSAINERMPGGTSDFELQSILQKGAHLQIIGNAINQQTVADFVRRLEFSSGIFTNPKLNVQGKDMAAQDAAAAAAAATATGGAKKTEAQVHAAQAQAQAQAQAEDAGRTFHFTIECEYNKPRDSSDEAAQANKPAAPAGK
jgi:Tfp pilus assembly protein PilN